MLIAVLVSLVAVSLAVFLIHGRDEYCLFECGEPVRFTAQVRATSDEKELCLDRVEVNSAASDIGCWARTARPSPNVDWYSLVPGDCVTGFFPLGSVLPVVDARVPCPT